MLKEASARLRHLRKGNGLTLREAATELGVSEAWLSRVERGHTDSISVDFAMRIKERFGIPVEMWSTKAAA